MLPRCPHRTSVTIFSGPIWNLFMLTDIVFHKSPYLIISLHSVLTTTSVRMTARMNEQTELEKNK